uniref:CASPASE_P20 domain-containing protein n=1 Tax=Macrostomum lignano TaxID=282301 RepID=A0A1I8H3D1_9PLAT
VSRLALILTENRFTEEPSVTNVKDILTNSGFRVESNVLGNYAQDIISFVPDEICRSTVQQLIIIVIANAQYPKCMDDFLKLMTDGGFFDLQKRFLLFCRVSNGNENTSDLQLQRKFSSNSFKYKSAIVGYKFDAEEKIRNFINWLAQEMNTCWNNSCLSAMLSRWLPAHDEEDLYMYPTGKCKRPFLRDILFHLDNREQQEGNGPMAAGAEGPMAAAAESPMNATVDNDQIASLIYPNKRTPTKPQALIILYFNKSAAPCESLQADCLRLMKLFKFRLGYLVTDIQVDSESQNDLEDRVKSFANQQDHGDSCVLIILSLSNGLLCGHSIINLFSQMSLSKQLKGKPRLFLLNEWQSGAQTGRLADPASPSEAFEILPDTQQVKKFHLMGLKTTVSIRSNLNGAEIKHEVKKFSEESDDGRSSVVAFMSHGRLGEVFGSDEEPCCRVPGQLPDEVSCLAFYPGMIIAHSTLPNDFSLRVKSKGSRFIQSFCTVLDLFPHNDIVTIIPLITRISLQLRIVEQPLFQVIDTLCGSSGRA